MHVRSCGKGFKFKVKGRENTSDEVLSGMRY